MGLLKSIGRFAKRNKLDRLMKKHVKFQGKLANVVGDVANAAGMRPVGAVLKGVGNFQTEALDRAERGESAGNALWGGVKKGGLEAGKGFAISKAGEMLRGGSKLLPSSGGDGLDAIDGLPSGDIAGSAEPGRFRSIVSGAGKFFGGEDGKFGMDDLIDAGRFAGQAYGDYQSGKREQDLYNRDRAEFDRLAPLRTAGMQGMMDNTRPDLSSVFAQPEQRYRRVNIGSRT